MLEVKKKTKILEGVQPEALPSWIFNSQEPLVLKNLVESWPAVQAARRSASDAAAYLMKFYSGTPVAVSVGEPSIRGRVFYNEDFTAFNFQSVKKDLGEFLSSILETAEDPQPPTLYMASTLVDHWLPGFQDENALEIAGYNPLVNLWIGNRIRVPAHYDLPENIACCIAGRRRFTLFPPDQLPNLYPGPLEFAPGGQSVSVVDFDEPDFQRYPGFREAIDNAEVAELEPGDGLFLPSMWWHHVEGLDELNVLMNYWWRQSQPYMGTPENALYHAILSVRDLPEAQKKAWQCMFEHYIFNNDEDSFSHIPDAGKGFLNPLDETGARKLRALLLNRLNR